MTPTYQDFLAARDRAGFLGGAVRDFRRGEAFRTALDAMAYFRGENPAVARKTILRAGKVEWPDEQGHRRRRAAVRDVVGNRVASGFFRRFVIQQAQYLLGNGVTLRDEALKRSLGSGFDLQLQRIGERALLQGVCWGFWNADHVEMIELCRDALSGFLPLCDELTGELRAGVQFWQRDARSPLLLRLFAEDGLSLHRLQDGRAVTLQPRRPYASGARRIPLVAFWGNEEHQSELSPAIRSKIDCYDRILSDFADNLDRANDVYWVLNNFSGTADDIAQMLEEIARLKAVCNYADGSGGASAEPHVLAVPYEARETALRLLERELYKDYMALDMDELTGGSLTNVAIRAASAALDLKCNRFEWQAFAFVQGILRLLGADTDAIRFQRQTIANESETVRDIAVMRGDIDLRTALRLNPYIQTEEVGEIARLAAPSAPSAPSGRSCSED